MKAEIIFKEGFKLYKKDFGTLIVGTLLAAVGSILVITAPPLFFGVYYMGVKVAKGEDVEINDVLKGFDYFITSWVMSVIMLVSVIIGLVLLIIPGLLLLVLFQYAIPIAIMENAGAIESLKRSVRMGKSNFETSLIIAVVAWILNSVGGTVGAGWLLAYPYTVVCKCRAVQRLSAGKK